MAYTSIDKSDEYFNTLLWSGDGTSSRSLTGVNFQPDLVWIKRRDNPASHVLFDAVRTAGSTKGIATNTTAQEGLTATEGTTANYGYVNSFDSDGFTVNAGALSSAYVNQSTDPVEKYVSWNWLANGAGSSNTDGDITSTVSVNTTSGFSITTYTATGTAGDTVGTGMSSGIDLYFIKRRDVAESIPVMTSLPNMGAGKYLYFNVTNDVAGPSSAFDNQVAPTSSGVITLGTLSTVNASGGTYVCYAFKSIKGFSKIGSYVGNGSTDGTFVYTGFKPAFVLIKCSSASATDWQLIDSTRSTFNVCNLRLQPNSSDPEAGSDTIDICSNGFKQRNTFGNFNTSGATYIYMAFAENPLVSSTGVPCTAR